MEGALALAGIRRRHELFATEEARDPRRRGLQALRPASKEAEAAGSPEILRH